MEEHLYDKFDSRVHVKRVEKENGVEGIEKKNEGVNEKDIDVRHDDSNSDKNSASDDTINEENSKTKNITNNSVSKKTKQTESWKKYEDDEDVKMAVKITTQLLLNNQPFSVKREEIFHTLNFHIPNCFSSASKRNAVIKYTKKYVNKILNLDLLEISNQEKKKKEYVLSQNILHENHNNLLLSYFDHTLRGMLIYLIPFFKIYENKIPINSLLRELQQCGWKTTKGTDEVIDSFTSQHIMNKYNFQKELNKKRLPLEDPVDLIVYLKLLGYINIYRESIKENQINSLEYFYCIPTTRYYQETSVQMYIKKLMQMPNKNYTINDLCVLFGEECLEKATLDQRHKIDK